MPLCGASEEPVVFGAVAVIDVEVEASSEDRGSAALP
jgi:hypothetical protein